MVSKSLLHRRFRATTTIQCSHRRTKKNGAYNYGALHTYNTQVH